MIFTIYQVAAIVLIVFLIIKVYYGLRIRALRVQHKASQVLYMLHVLDTLTVDILQDMIEIKKGKHK